MVGGTGFGGGRRGGRTRRRGRSGGRRCLGISDRRSRAQLTLHGDAAAIDSHVLDVFLTQNRAAAADLRIIDMLGPSSIPPIVIVKTVDQALKRKVQETLLTMHEDPLAASALHAGAIDRFVQVSDGDYQDIREMCKRLFVWHIFH